MFENRIEYAAMIGGGGEHLRALLKERDEAKRKGKQKRPVTSIPQKPQSLAEALAEAREATKKLMETI